VSDAIKISGIKNTQNALRLLDKRMTTKVALKAVKKGAQVTRKAISKSAPVYRGKPKKDVVVGAVKKGFRVYKSKINTPRKNKVIGVYVSIRKMTTDSGKGRGTLDPFYARFLEKGWNVRGKRKGAIVRGLIRVGFLKQGKRRSKKGKTNVDGLHFIEKSGDASAVNSTNVIEQSFKKDVEAEKRKLRFK